MSGETLAERSAVIEAIEASWSAATSATPDEWSEDNRGKGQCDASSFVLWEHFGGELVLGQVFVDDDMTEHHYWNRIDGVDIDVTRAQFTGKETITEVKMLDGEALRANQATMRAELADRIALLRSAVGDSLG